MNVTREQSGDVVIVHAGPARLMHPSLSEFSTLVTGEIASGKRKIILDFGGVEYLDSAAIGCRLRSEANRKNNFQVSRYEHTV